MVPTSFIATVTRLVRACLAAGLAALLILVALPGMGRADDTTADERTVVLVDPGVVFVETSVSVFVQLSYQDFSQISGKSTISDTYRFDYSSGSGFAINPSGVIVTASHVVDPEPSKIRAYAANKLLRVELNKGEDPFGRYTLIDGFWNGLLQQCYDQVTCTFRIKRTVQVYTPVQIAGISAPKPLSARVLASTGFGKTDVAVLQVDADNMPTVPLATTATDLKSGQSITALGFPGSAQDLPSGFTEPAKLFGRVSNVRSEGASKIVEANIANVPHGMSGGPGVDSNGRVVGLISYSRLDPDDGSPTQIYLRTVDDIRAALRGAGGVQAARGEVDTLFGQAMSYFWDRHYSAALPLYQKVLNLYDGHPLAKKYLSQAQAKAGGSEDLPLPTPKATGERSRVLMLGIAALLVLVVVAAVGTLLFRRRRPASAPETGALSPSVDLSGYGAAGGMRQAADDALPPLPVNTLPSGPGMPTSQDATRDAEPWEEAGTAAVATVTAPSEPVGESTGFSTPVIRFCRRCGNQLDVDDRFCSVCGHQVR
jgi:S1-C subfamily serine protease